MKVPFSMPRQFFTPLVVLLVAAPAARAALLITSLGSITEDFNFLTASPDGATTAWVNDQATRNTSGSPGWYWQTSTTSSLVYQTNVGSSITPAPFAFGDSGSADRAIGDFGGPGDPNVAWGVVLKNETGQTLSHVTVSYRGEQWRRNSSADKLAFSYRQSSAAITDLEPGTLEGSSWIAVSGLDFDNLIFGTATGLNGNLNGESPSEKFAVTVPNMSYLALRWRDGGGTGGELGMAIDDLTVTVLSVPEPGAMLLVGMACAAWALPHRGRKLLAARRR